MAFNPDDLEALKAARDAADRAYNEALTRLDAAIQTLPADFPHPPPPPDEHQVTPLNTLWRIEAPPAASGLARTFVDAVRRAVAPLFARQEAFNAALVDHVNRNLAVERETRAAVESTLVVLRDQLGELVRFQSLLVVFLQQITPYVDTRDRDVAGVVRGLSGAINAVAAELTKRADAMLARDRGHEQQVGDLASEFEALRARVDDLQRSLAGRASGR
jgi:hypothetical protein